MSHPANGIHATGSDSPPPSLLAAARRLLPLLDPQPGRPGLVDTPRRFAQALEGAMKGEERHVRSAKLLLRRPESRNNEA